MDKYIGDAIMTAFGASLEQPDHSFRSCRTAMEMKSVLKRLCEKWAAEGGPEAHDQAIMGSSVRVARRK